MNARKQNVKGKASTVPVGLLWGIGTALMIVTLGSIVLARFLESNIVEWKDAGYVIMGILIISSYVGAAMSCGKIKSKRMQISLLFAGLFSFTLLSITLLCFGGQYEGVIVTTLLILAASIGAGLTQGNKSRRKTKRKNYFVHC